jgi:hypothetical protein
MILEKILEVFQKMISAKLMISLIVGSFSSYYVYQSKKSNHPTATIENEDEIITDSGQPKFFSKNSGPSNVKSRVQNEYIPKAHITSYDGSNFTQVEDDSITDATLDQDTDRSPASQNSYSSNFIPLQRQDMALDDFTTPDSKIPFKDTNISSSWNFSGDRENTENKILIRKDSSIISSSLSGTATAATNTCSSNILGGTFGNAVAVTLTCTFPSTIKYCLAIDSCCDPETDGVVYGTQVIIGPTSGNYCLSYMGESDSGGSSIVADQNYTINSILPNLTVGHTKTYYQTTELIGTSFISSTDFGKLNYYVGQVNLKSHDPGPSGLNYSCSEILANYVSLPAPMPTPVLSLFDVSFAPVSSQVEVPLVLSHLAYGDNYITSYIENNTNTTPLYSCSTTKINLDDFSYFEADVSQSEPGTDSIREFEGSFESYGFFEAESTVSRGIAGASSAEVAGENLKSGLFGMFY